MYSQRRELSVSPTSIFICIAFPYLLEYLQQITYSSPQYLKIVLLIIEVLQQITNSILITKIFLVIIKIHPSLT